MQTIELFRELQKKEFFKGYGNKAAMGCGRIIAYIEVDRKEIGTVIISMVGDSTLTFSFLNDLCCFDENHQVASVEDFIAAFTAFIKGPNIRH